MLRTTDNLRSDHAVTSAGLAVLEAVAAHVRHGGTFPAQDCVVLLRFLREFVLAVHMRKETELVCPAVAMRGDEHAAALVGDLLRMQDEVTELAHSLVLFWEPTDDLSAAERLGFADTAESIIARLRRMQAIEELELFPACDASVPADDQITWASAVAKLEAERGSRAVWVERLAKLKAKWCA